MIQLLWVASLPVDQPTDATEACVFFATTTVGSYDRTWTREYMTPNADWRDSYMAAGQQQL